MENKLKVGQSCEVVEVLRSDTYSDRTLLKVGGFTVGDKHVFANGVSVIPNGINIHRYKNNLYLSFRLNEIKPIGKLTITKLK